MFRWRAALTLLGVLICLPTALVAAKRKASVNDWPQWRGPHRDGISPETGLLEEWPDSGPPLVWEAKGLGNGFASVAVVEGRIYTLGSSGGREHLSAYQAADGKPLWSCPVGSGDHSNGTPTVDGDLVFAIGLQGDLVCANASDGQVVWRKNFKSNFGGRMMSGWGFSESPLVDGDRLICTPGAQDAMLVALDKRTGETIWKAAMPADVGNKGKDGAGYSSIVVSYAAGVKQYVQLVGRGVIGVSADDGKVLWTYNRVANPTANIPTPIVKDDYVFCSSGYGEGGTALLKLSKQGDGVKATEVYFRKAKELQNHHGGMILLGDYVYFGKGHNNGFPVCVELQSGKPAWEPGRGPGTGSAAVAYADGNLYFRYQNGVMAMIEATPEKYTLKSKFQLPMYGRESWPHPVIADGRLYLRDQDVLMAYDIAAR